MEATSDIKTLGNIVFLKFLVIPKYRFYRHFTLILFIGLELYFSDDNIIVEPVATYAKIVAIVSILSLFYFNMYVLIPKLLFCNKYIEYTMAIVVLISLLFGVAFIGRYVTRPYLNEHRSLPPSNVFFFFFILTVLVVASAGVKLFQQWTKDTQKIIDLEKATLQSELQQLKNQINPHFLFNMLNNANVLTRKDPDKASQVLIKLSDLLRYQLYDSSRPKVLLTADIHFLDDFLNLEKIRRDNFEFIVNKSGELNGVQIAPLLFITFVENAVKHNMDGEKQSYVHLCFDVKQNILSFQCINSKPSKVVVKNNNGGLGLANVTRRMKLIYPQKHTLNIQNNRDTYAVNLTINL